MSSGPSKVIVLDPDPRAGRQVQLGFEREGVPVAVPALADGALDIADMPGVVLVGGRDRTAALDLIRRAKAWLTAKNTDVPIVFTGRGVPRRELEAAGADEVVAHPVFLRDIVTIGRMLRGVPQDHRDHLVGNLVETTGVLTLVRAFSALGRSAVLTLIRGLRRGEVRFFHGEVTSAQVGLIHGQAALHQLLLWTDARFDYAHEDIVRRQQIPLSPEELFADAEQFLEGVREHAGQLSPSTVLEQNVQRVQTLGKQIPTEVHGVLRMFDGHRVLADILEDSPYRVFETLRVAQKAVEVGLLREVSTQRPKATWRAVLAIEEWLVGTETRDAVVERTATLDSGPVKAPPKSRRKKRKSKPKPAPASVELKGSDIDWGALVPRVIGAELGPLSGVVPSQQAHGEVELPTRDKPREGLEALMDTEKRQKIFPTDIGLEPKVVIAAEPVEPTPPVSEAVTEESDEWERAEWAAKEQALAEEKARARTDPAAASAQSAVPTTTERADTARHVAPPPPAATEPVVTETAGSQATPAAAAETAAAETTAAETAAAETAAAETGTSESTESAEAAPTRKAPSNTDRHTAPPPAVVVAPPPVMAAAGESATSTEPGTRNAPGDTTRHATPLRAPATTASASPAAKTDNGAGGIDPATAALVAVPTYMAPMKSDPVAAVTAVPGDIGAPRPPRPAGVTDASALVRALVAEVVPPNDAAPTSGPIPTAAVDGASAAVTEPVRRDIEDAVTAPVPARTGAPFHAPSPAHAHAPAMAPSASALIVEPVTIAEAAGTSVAITDVVTVTGSPDTAIVTASPRMMITEQPATSDVAAVTPARTASNASIEAAHTPATRTASIEPMMLRSPPGEPPSTPAVAAPTASSAAPTASSAAPTASSAAPTASSAAPTASSAAPTASSAAPTASSAAPTASSAAPQDATSPEIVARAGASAPEAALVAAPPTPVAPQPAPVAAPVAAPPAPVAAPQPAPVAAPQPAPVAAPPAPVAAPQPAPVAASPAPPDDATPIATDDEPSDGVVRAAIASADTARVSRPRHRPPTPEHDGPPIKETTGEIRHREKRDIKEPAVTEPSILVSDLAAAHDAIAAAVAKPAPTPPPADAASASRELEVSDVRRDAVAFSDAEEAFFRGAEKTSPAPKVETFDDLDEGYQPPGFWDRVFGRKKPKP